jgi:hypothetical protein
MTYTVAEPYGISFEVRLRIRLCLDCDSPEHPSIERQLHRIFVRRVWMMTLAPELVVAWAARQYFTANDVAERNKGNEKLCTMG